jgi:hypothetical protein
MDKETIQQIATEVVARLPFGARYSVVYGVITVLIAGLGVWFGSFLKAKGQNFATKQDFNELKRQLKENTELVETIKSEVSQRDWAQREWTNLRRIKLEAVLEKMHECEVFLDQRRDAALQGKAGTSSNCIFELEAIATLYFPELKNEVDQFARTCRKDHIEIVKFGQAVLNARGDKTSEDAAVEGYKSQWNFEEFRLGQNTLIAAARSLLERIMNVDEKTPPCVDHHGARPVSALENSESKK